MDVLKKFRIWIKDVLFRRQKSKIPELFCIICDLPKQSRFCNNCQKETPNMLKAKAQMTGKSKLSFEGEIIIGEIRWAYYVIAYSIILTLLVSIISLVEEMPIPQFKQIVYIDVSWRMRIIFIVITACLFFYLCFFNERFGNKIYNFFENLKKRKFKSK